VPVNAPQFGAVLNGATAPVANSLPFNFAAASTNSVIPDFKTIAASFFAIPPAATTIAPAETKTTAGAKSVGPFLPRGREGNQEKDTKSSELPETFLPAISVYTLPTLTPQAPRPAEPMPSAQPTQTNTDSLLPICALPVVNQPTDLAQILASQSTTEAPTKVSPLQKGEKVVSNTESIQPARPKVDFGRAANTDPDDKTGFAKVNTKPAPTQVVTDEEITNVARDEKSPVGKVAFSAQLATSVSLKLPIDKAQSQTKVTPNSGETTRVAESEKTAPSVAANKIDTGLNTIDIDTRRTSATAFGRKLSSTIEKPAVSSENKKLAQTKQSADIAKEAPANKLEPVSAAEADQAVQQPTPAPQSIDDAIKAVIPQAVVLEHSVSGPVLGRTTNLHSTQPGKSATKSTQEEPASMAADTATPTASDTTSTEVLNGAKPTPVIESNSKASIGKGKTDTTVKKTQRTTAENQSDTASVANSSHRTETDAVSSGQSTTSKNHDSVSPQVNPAPHAKSASVRDTPGTSDKASPSTAQLPEFDDITPPSHTGVNTAKLVQGITQSELRVGLQTRDFGNIDIRTSASRHEFSAQISVEHSDMAHTLTSELPNLYARLNEQQVPVTNIHIHNQSLSTSSGLDQRSQQSSQQSQSGGFTKHQMEPARPVIQEVFGSTDRLDIRV
jgi:hypothetical protein